MRRSPDGVRLPPIAPGSSLVTLSRKPSGDDADGMLGCSKGEVAVDVGAESVGRGGRRSATARGLRPRASRRCCVYLGPGAVVALRTSEAPIRVFRGGERRVLVSISGAGAESPRRDPVLKVGAERRVSEGDRVSLDLGEKASLPSPERELTAASTCRAVARRVVRGFGPGEGEKPARRSRRLPLRRRRGRSAPRSACRSAAGTRRRPRRRAAMTTSHQQSPARRRAPPALPRRSRRAA